MSHSVRRLWTGAIMLSMGCQAVPSTMTSFFDAAQKPSSMHVASTPPPVSASSPAKAPEPPSVMQDGVDRKRGALHSASGILDQTVRSILQSPAPETRRTALFSGRPRPGPTGIAPSDPHHTPSQIADADAGVTAKENSVLQDFRSRLFGKTSDESTTEPATSLAHAPLTLDPSPFAEPADQESSPILPVGHEMFVPGRRHALRLFEEPLEAPTPFSAITARTASVAEKPDPPPQNAEQTGAEEPPSEEGLVGSLFDVFGIGGDRAAKSRSDGSGSLRRANSARLQRPPAAGTPEELTPSIEALTKSLQTVHWQEELDRLTTLLETQLAMQTPGESTAAQDYYIRQHVALRLLYLIGSRRPEALQAIPNCDPDQQEFWTELLWALSNIFDDEAMPDQAERARETAEQLRAALTHLTPVAGLKLKQTHFCRQINGFGNYVPFERDEFSPGQSVLVYTEVENFVSRPTPEGQFITTLQTTLRIHQGDVTGPIVFEELLPATEDQSLSQRRDYFHSYRLTLPPKLTPGPHVLTLTIRDQNSQKLNTTSLSFAVD